MKLLYPFIISARLLPALKIGDATLSLAGIAEPVPVLDEGRERASFFIDFEDGTFYLDTNLRSGVGHFRCAVEAFDAFLGFLEAAAESYEFEQRTGRKGENTDLFPPRVVEWASENKNDIEDTRSAICDEDGYALAYLIEV